MHRIVVCTYDEYGSIHSGTARVLLPHALENWNVLLATVYGAVRGSETAYKVYHSILGEEIGNNVNSDGSP